MMNAFINVKTAEKNLQFGPTKCKSMLVGKDTENVVNNELFVDKWIIDYKKNKDTGKDDIEETYSGQVPIGKTTEHKYLGFVISSTGDNMANINQINKYRLTQSSLPSLNKLKGRICTPKHWSELSACNHTI